MNKLIAVFIFGICLTIIAESEIKKEIDIPFPDSKSIEAKKEFTVIQNPSVKQDGTINIPFPDDKKERVNETEIIFSELNKDRNVPPKNQLPLEKILVVPPLSIEVPKLEASTVLSAKDINTILKKIGKDEVSKETPVEILKDKPLDKKTEQFKKAITENKPKTDSAKNPRELSKLNINKDEEIKSPKVNLPNLDSKSKSKKVAKKEDESIPPYERSKYHLNREDKDSTGPELNATVSTSGIMSNPAKMDQIRLLGLARKKNEAKSVIDSVDDPIYKFKGLYELAIALENTPNKKLKEEAIPYYLQIVTEAPKDNPLLPKSLWAISNLHYTLGEHTQALDHLSNIILQHKNSEFIDDAVYLSARIYEESTSIRDLNRAKKYYSMFLQNAEKPNFRSSLYLPFVKSRSEKLNIE